MQFAYSKLISCQATCFSCYSFEFRTEK